MWIIHLSSKILASIISIDQLQYEDVLYYKRSCLVIGQGAGYELRTFQANPYFNPVPSRPEAFEKIDPILSQIKFF